MNEWIGQLSDLLAAGEPVVRVTIAGVRGSAPREVGACMLVTAGETIGTIGGGQLEYQCTRRAVDRLGGDRVTGIERYPLGASLGQCCGGVVEVLFEPMLDGMPAWLRTLAALHGQREPAVLVTGLEASASERLIVTSGDVFGSGSHARVEIARERLLERDAAIHGEHFFEPVIASDFNIAVFGAGHVGAAVVGLLATLDCNIRWIDSRQRIFRRVPNNVQAIETAEPGLEVAALPPGSHVLVMTHSHAIDFDVCVHALRRNDLAYVGLIGSEVKRRRFMKRFHDQGLRDNEISRLTCPIGVDGVSGKKPAEIAVAATAEMLAIRDAAGGQALPGNVTRLG